MAISVSIGYANTQLCAGGTSQYSAMLSPCGAKIGDRIGKKSNMMDTMHRKNEILSYGASRGVAVLDTSLLRMRIATKKIYATRIRTADAETPKVQALMLSRTDLATIVVWLDGSGGLGSILGISENAYRHTQSEKTRKIIIFALFERKNYRHTIIK